MSYTIQERTESEAAVAARNLLRNEGVGTLATYFHNGRPSRPGHHPTALSNEETHVTIHLPTCPALLPMSEKLSGCNCEINVNETQEEKNAVEGYPFNLFDYYVDVDETHGDPIFLSSDIQKSVINLKFNNKAGFTVRANTHTKDGRNINAMANGRLCLVGDVKQLDKDTDSELIETVREEFLRRHPDTSYWIDFDDFHLFRFHTKAVYWIGGFGGSHYIGFINTKLFQEASPVSQTYRQLITEKANAVVANTVKNEGFYKLGFWVLFLMIVAQTYLLS